MMIGDTIINTNLFVACLKKKLDNKLKGAPLHYLEVHLLELKLYNGTIKLTYIGMQCIVNGYDIPRINTLESDVSNSVNDDST